MVKPSIHTKILNSFENAMLQGDGADTGIAKSSKNSLFRPMLVAKRLGTPSLHRHHAKNLCVPKKR
jgi:hypothetical protein